MDDNPMDQYDGDADYGYPEPTIEHDAPRFDDNATASYAGPPPPPKKKKRRGGGFWGFLRTTGAVIVMVTAGLIGAGLVAFLVIYANLRGELLEDLERLQSFEGVEDFQVSRIYDRDGELLYELFDEGRRTEVDIEELPPWVLWSTIATEDDTFYENPGFDPVSIARAAYEWFDAGEIVSGGSTITQQLIKQIVFDPQEQVEQTLRRKLREATLAYILTNQLEKDQILELYLNEVYYGNLAYGIEGAANVYFDKPAAELTLGEAAFLTGLIQSPVAYDPYTNFEIAKGRQAQVLELMVLHGYLTPEEAVEALTASPQSTADLADTAIALEAPHFTVEARNRLAQLPIDPTLLARGGLTITTTLDMDMHRLAEGIAQAKVAEVGAEFNMTNAAILIMNPNTGEVLAMVGSVDYDNEAIDGNVNVLLTPQQPGSTFKALTYALALEQGQTPAEIIWDVPMAYDTGAGQGYDYEPRNYDGRFHGPVRMRGALANSYNIPAVTTAREVGIPQLLDFSRRMGVESLANDPGQYGLSLTLGGAEVTPLEMTTAFAVFANGGREVKPFLIAEVRGPDGEVLYSRESTVGGPILDERIAWLISDILSDNAARTPAMGPDSELLVDFPAAAKTGTTNDFRDNWTIGYTPHVVVGVWTGNTDNTPMADGVSGLTGAAPIWNETMTALYAQPNLLDELQAAGLPDLRADFPRPDGLEQREICVLSALRDPQPASEGCPRRTTEWFILPDPASITPTPDLPTATPPPTIVVDEESGQTVEPPLVRRQIEPGLMELVVLPLDDEQRQTAEADLQAITDSPLYRGVPAPTTPAYCEMPQAAITADLLDLLSPQVFIAAPPDPIDALRARNWALANGVPIEPGYACNEGLLGEVEEEAEEGPPVGTAEFIITSPEPGAELYEPTPIIGTAIWNPEEYQFYKLEFGVGSIPDEWTTFGEASTEMVTDGVLEVFQANALPPGDYVIRLVVVRWDGNFPPPYQVQVRIVEPPAEDDEQP